MAVSYTTTYNLTKPEVGASEDEWGGLLNTNFDELDNLLDGTTPVTGIDINGGTIDGAVIGGATPAAITGTAITGTSFATSGDFTFGDNDKAIFGAGSDLQIYHDGSHSYVSDQGTGNIKVLADDFVLKNSADTANMIVALTGGAATLYHDGDTRLATTSTGIDVTGTVTADGLTVGDGHTISDDGFDNLVIASSSAESIILNSNTFATVVKSDAQFRVETDFGTDRFKVDTSTGDIRFYEDTGTTPKFFWDASAESLELNGNTAYTLYLNSTSPILALTDINSFTDANDRMHIRAAGDNMQFQWYDDSASTTTNLMVIDSSGNVGIGTSSPAGLLELRAADGDGTFNIVSITNSVDSGNKIAFFGANRADTDEEMAYIKPLLVTNNGGSGNVQQGHLAFGTSGSEAMRIDRDGNVGIGTGSPDATIHANVGTAGNNIAKFSDPNNRALIVKAVTAGMEIITTEETDETDADRALIFKRGTSETMRIDSSGNLLVGTLVVPSSSILGVRIKPGSTSFSSGGFTGGYTHIAFLNGNGTVGSILTNGSATSYNTSSDYRLKTDVQPMTGASARVQSLKPCNFAWKADGTRVDGFLAHEAQEVVPEAVTGAKDAMRDEEYEVTPAVLDEDGNVVTEAVMGTRSVPDYQGIDQSKLVPLLTAALQEALTKIDALETRITALEG